MDSRTWYFTFGIGTPFRHKLQPIKGDYEQARETMLAIYDRNWCSQYSADQAQGMIDKGYDLLPVIDADV